MKIYSASLKEVSLKEAVDMMESRPQLTVFYTYGIGEPIHLLDRESLPSAIKYDATFLTPDSFVKVEEIE